MKDADIEELVATRIRTAVEAAADDCIREINAAGHDLQADPDGILEWIDAIRRTRLSIICSLAVSVEPEIQDPQPPDPELEAFLELAESGNDRLATVLNLLEGDIANGGFLQLVENKEPSFIREAIDCLRAIGARKSATMVEQVLAMLEKRADVIREYDRLHEDVSRLDSEFFELGESIPQLVVRHRRSAGS